MSPLEQFVRDHRQDFDAESPGPQVWEKIRADIDTGKKNTFPIHRIRRSVWWSAAAILLLILTAGIWYNRHTPSGRGGTIALNPPTGGAPASTPPAAGQPSLPPLP